MKKILFAFYLIAGFAFMNSCTTDFDLYADYKDISIVYGLMDNSDDTSWIKITKAFTGPGNALLIAQNPDSSNYPYKLDVKLIGVKNGNNLQPIVFDTLTIHNKIPGDSTFYFPDQLVYFAKTKFDQDAKYKLIINNRGKEITAETPLVGDFIISRPNRFISFTNNSAIEWSAAKNGKRYESFFVFNYKELLPGNTDTLYKSIRWSIGVEKDNSGEESYSGDKFYSNLVAELDDIPGVKRWAGLVNIIVACGSGTLNSYIEINEADNSLLTEVPVFSNIEGGTGIFASRHTAYKDVMITPKTLEKLINEYPELHFKYPTK
jgi:hypothetical protein